MTDFNERKTQPRVRAENGLSASSQTSRDVPLENSLHANEAVSRVVAYASPYVFWVTVGCLSIAIFAVQ